MNFLKCSQFTRVRMIVFWGEEGTRMLRHTGICCPNELLFYQKSSDICPILVKKSLEGGPISPKLQKQFVKSAVLAV